MKKEKIKLSLYENRRIVVENYLFLKDLSSESIVIDNYVIKGNKLKINQMDDMIVEIIGVINDIEVTYV